MKKNATMVASIVVITLISVVPSCYVITANYFLAYILTIAYLVTDFKKILKYQISDLKSSFVPLLNDNNDLSLLFYTILFNYSLIYFVPVAGKC